jgi:hypothetical protein
MTQHESGSSNTSELSDADKMQAAEVMAALLLRRLRALRSPGAVFRSLVAHHNMRDLPHPSNEQEVPIGNKPDTR